MEPAVPNQIEIPGLASPNDCPSRNRLQVADDILPALRSIPLQLEVNVLCRRTICQPEHPRPCLLVRDVPFPPALGTGPVTGGQGRRFVQEEQFRVMPGLHDLPLSFLERKQAGHPGIARRPTNDVAPIIMQATTVAHEGAARSN